MTMHIFTEAQTRTYWARGCFSTVCTLPSRLFPRHFTHRPGQSCTGLHTNMCGLSATDISRFGQYHAGRVKTKHLTIGPPSN